MSHEIKLVEPPILLMAGSEIRGQAPVEVVDPINGKVYVTESRLVLVGFLKHQQSLPQEPPTVWICLSDVC